MIKPALRKLMLIAHIVASIGWFGAAASVLALGIVGTTSGNADLASAAYLATEVVWRFVVLPFSLMALCTGLVQALGTPWRLVRYYWVLTKFLITVGAVALLLLHTHSLLPALAGFEVSTEAAVGEASAHVHGGMPPRIHLVVAAGGTLLLLLINAAISVYKPWGRTRLGGDWREPTARRENAL